MKKNLLLLILNCLCLPFLQAQVEQDAQQLTPCGTLDHKSTWLKKYQAAPDTYAKNFGTILYVPMTLHVLGDNDGGGYFSMTNTLNAFCELNEQMAESEIQFFLAGDINYINNTDWYDHATVLEGAAMMFENNVANTLNTYIVSDPAGNCGYNLPYAGIALAKSCATSGNRTWAHEVGHNLSLPHPFLGWEGGIGHDGTMPANFNEPAPTTVVYDYTYFQDTLIIDTMIIDTAYVEYVDGRNCDIAADGFCDTSPDYIAQGWSCNGNDVSPLQQKDPDGVSFRSDGTLIMSYSDDNCQIRFSPEQIAAMRANLIDEKPELISQETPQEQIVEEIVPQVPLDDEIAQFDNAYFEWTTVADAEQYLVQISRLPSFSIKDEYVVDANSLIVDNLEADKTYYWRVRGFNHYSFCADFTDNIRFEAAMISDISDVTDLSHLSLRPNLMSAGQAVTLSIHAEQALHLDVKVYEVSGKMLFQYQVQTGVGSQDIALPTEGLLRGLYFVNVEVEGAKIVRKLVVE